ncbi:hypothetical protein ACFVIM_13810 [Streptomyces sp. NPDC057638]|uniref:hypothetical protein n=1 Tax=Streptomyces sp. NPDC057638 TaxID=3346190 RepID=UPI0036A52D84
MPSPRARADNLAERLTAAGYEPHVVEERDCVKTEVHVQDQVSADATAWHQLLALLETADAYGLDSGGQGRIAYARFTATPP